MLRVTIAPLKDRLPWGRSRACRFRRRFSWTEDPAELRDGLEAGLRLNRGGDLVREILQPIFVSSWQPSLGHKWHCYSHHGQDHQRHKPRATISPARARFGQRRTGHVVGGLAARHTAKADVMGRIDASIGSGFDRVGHGAFLWVMSSVSTIGDLGTPRLKEVFRCSEGFHDFCLSSLSALEKRAANGSRCSHGL